ncbi:MAG: hypothetical protein JKY65_17080 [Planctomycetes bacterium]|nr:hypothetical protein [Planctomycetota bacterium]
MVPFSAVAIPLGVLLLVRLLAQERLKRRAPVEGPARGWVSVWTWFALYLGLLALALRAAWSGLDVPTFGVGLGAVALAYALRGAALCEIAGWYHEGIAVRAGQTVVQSGVYRRLRHPLHLSLLVECLGLAVWAGSATGWGAVIVVLAVLVWRNRDEEAALLERLGRRYADYLRTPAWDLIDLVPRARPSLPPPVEGAPTFASRSSDPVRS